MTISLQLNTVDSQFLQTCAKNQGLTLEELVMHAVREQIEDAQDRQEFVQAKQEFEQNPITYSHEAVCKMFGVS